MFDLEPKRLSPATTTGATRNCSSAFRANSLVYCGCDQCVVAEAARRVRAMARPAKPQQFEIWDDANRTHCDGEKPARGTSAYRRQEAHEDGPRSGSGVVEAATAAAAAAEEGEEEEEDEEEEEEEDMDSSVLHHQLDDADADDERRRGSGFTFASVSSLPEFESDYERRPLQMHPPYTPPTIRPSFRRPESVKKMQMSSPAPSERSLRRSVLSPPRPRTPRSARSSVKSNFGRQKWPEGVVEAAEKEYPLVLLHLTLLPVELRWSRQAVEDILPPSTLEALRLLQSKASETIIQRGILIPHPRDEYELLEERLLEALELQEERISRGHFRARESTSSADSGVGTSVEDAENESCCATCHAKVFGAAVTAGGKTWSIRIFAANGLMRAPAWTAAWSEMERVDVEILPWIDEDLRRALDERALQDAAKEREQQEEEAVRISAAEEQFRVLQQEQVRAKNVQHPARRENHTKDGSSQDDTDISTDKADDLPQVYQPKDIPLSLLLKNYFYLLAQDKRNIAIFGLAMLALVVSLRASLVPGLDISALPPVCENIQAQPPVLQQAPTSRQTNSVYTADYSSMQPPVLEQESAMTIANEPIAETTRSSVTTSISEDQGIVDDESLRIPIAELQKPKQETALDLATLILDAAQCPNLASLISVFGEEKLCSLA